MSTNRSTSCGAMKGGDGICARFIISNKGDIPEMDRITDEIDKKYGEQGMSVKTGEIFPTDTAPVVSVVDGKPALSLMRWGFPKWDGKGVIINAKCETAGEKRMFAAALAHRRCVIPATGFIEWTSGEGKRKYVFNTENDPMLYMAGLYSDYVDMLKDEQLTERFVILTTNANDSISDVHNRMPVVLYKNEIVRWLKDFSYTHALLYRSTVQFVRKSA